ncbi:DUF1661 domain-containing protein [Porphyromonas gingivalis]
MFNPARDFFNSRAKTKTFSDHPFNNQIIHFLQPKREIAESLGE